MEQSTLVSGRIIKDGDSVNNIGQMDLFMKDSGKNTPQMEMVD